MIYQINLSEPIRHSVRHAKEQIDMLAQTPRTGISSNVVQLIKQWMSDGVTDARCDDAHDGKN